MPKSPEIRRPPRRLRLLDILALIVATALGLAGIRAYWQEMGRLIFIPDEDPWMSIEGVSIISSFAAIMLACWTLTLTILRCLPPRPPLRKALVQPGAAACFAVSVSILLGIIGWTNFIAQNVNEGVMDVTFFEYSYYLIIAELANTAGRTAFAVWMLLLAARRWRGHADWIEWASRGLISAWILTALVRSLFWLLRFGFSILGF